MRTYGAEPWRFRAVDFEPHIGFRLTGEPVAATWDEDLAPKTAIAGLGLHEEAIIDQLLADLAG
jgi:hypothetical protein